jgi:hypothetical protein
MSKAKWAFGGMAFGDTEESKSEVSAPLWKPSIVPGFIERSGTGKVSRDPLTPGNAQRPEGRVSTSSLFLADMIEGASTTLLGLPGDPK